MLRSNKKIKKCKNRLQKENFSAIVCINKDVYRIRYLKYDIRNAKINQKQGGNKDACN